MKKNIWTNGRFSLWSILCREIMARINRNDALWVTSGVFFRSDGLKGQRKHRGQLINWSRYGRTYRPPIRRLRGLVRKCQHFMRRPLWRWWALMWVSGKVAFPVWHMASKWASLLASLRTLAQQLPVQRRPLCLCTLWNTWLMGQQKELQIAIPVVHQILLTSSHFFAQSSPGCW